MKKHIFSVVCILIFTALTFGVCAYVMSEQNVTVAENAPNVGKAENKDMMYMLKEYCGNIGVYICAEDEYFLISVVDADVFSLPKEDTENLQNGIYLENKEQMLKLVEDFIS